MIRIVIALVSVSWVLAANAIFWEVRSNTPTTAQLTMNFQQAGNPITGVLLINFMRKFDCQPEVGFLWIEGIGSSLGTPEGQQWAKSNMTISIDGSLAWKERTAIAKYSNAYGANGMANTGFVEKIMAGREAVIEPLEGLQKFAFPLEGASDAIHRASSNCINN